MNVAERRFASPGAPGAGEEREEEAEGEGEEGAAEEGGQAADQVPEGGQAAGGGHAVHAAGSGCVEGGAHSAGPRPSGSEGVWFVSAGVEVPSKDTVPKKKPVYGDKRRKKPNTQISPEGGAPPPAPPLANPVRASTKMF